jgi:hypothetical protein
MTVGAVQFSPPARIDAGESRTTEDEGLASPGAEGVARRFAGGTPGVSAGGKASTTKESPSNARSLARIFTRAVALLPMRSPLALRQSGVFVRFLVPGPIGNYDGFRDGVKER